MATIIKTLSAAFASSLDDCRAMDDAALADKMRSVRHVFSIIMKAEQAGELYDSVRLADLAVAALSDDDIRLLEGEDGWPADNDRYLDLHTHSARAILNGVRDRMGDRDSLDDRGAAAFDATNAACLAIDAMDPQCSGSRESLRLAVAELCLMGVTLSAAGDDTGSIGAIAELVSQLQMEAGR